MRGLLIKDYITIKKKYGVTRLIMDIVIIVVLLCILGHTGAIYINFLLIPIEIMSMVISLTTCDEQWKWEKYVISLPVSKTQIVRSRYIFATIMSFLGFIMALIVNTISYLCFSQYTYGFYLFITSFSFVITLLFLSFVLPSNYSLGVNAGFAVMIILVALLIVLGIWLKVTNGVIMLFLINNFEICVWIVFGLAIVLWSLSYFVSVSIFKRKYR